MKYVLSIIFLILSKVLFALNTPFYLPLFSNHLQAVNPAFYGHTILDDGRYSRLEFGMQTLYTYQLSDFEHNYDFPIFQTYKNEGFTNSRPGGFRRDANQQMVWINGREVLSKSFSLGFGLAFQRIALDKYSDGKGLDFGMSLIHHRSRHSAVWSLGFNAKFDYFDYEFVNLVDFKSREKANIINGDIGLAYFSKNRRLKAGLSCYNILNKEISKYESSMTFEGPYSMMHLFYSRLFLLNINKTSVISKNKKTNLEYGVLFNLESEGGLYLNDIYLNLGVSKKIKEKSVVGIGLNCNKFIFGEFVGPLTGLQLKSSWKHFEMSYNYSMNLNVQGVSSGKHFVGVRGRI